MIRLYGGAGIVVRKLDYPGGFYRAAPGGGHALAEAVIDAGAVRSGDAAHRHGGGGVGAGVILFDPIFQGLARFSLMAGEVASLLISRMAVPVLFLSHQIFSHRGALAAHRAN